MYIDITPFYYHNIIDIKDNCEKLSERKECYNVTLTKNYFDCVNKDEVKLLLIQDLKILRKQLETELNMRYSFKEGDDEYVRYKNKR